MLSVEPITGLMVGCLIARLWVLADAKHAAMFSSRTLDLASSAFSYRIRVATCTMSHFEYLWLILLFILKTKLHEQLSLKPKQSYNTVCSCA
ncbi:hypothetical protein F5Y08DRAFT_24084 [Xylaria arbuscula]|nr:hypothetical protein F5Y08DRAFT_24084 [Xylaria arbuscula]